MHLHIRYTYSASLDSVTMIYSKMVACWWSCDYFSRRCSSSWLCTSMLVLVLLLEVHTCTESGVILLLLLLLIIYQLPEFFTYPNTLQTTEFLWYPRIALYVYLMWKCMSSGHIIMWFSLMIKCAPCVTVCCEHYRPSKIVSEQAIFVHSSKWHIFCWSSICSNLVGGSAAIYNES